jgi:hypothetical protein
MPSLGDQGQAMIGSGLYGDGYLAKNGIRSPSECLHAANNGKVRFKQESPPPIGATRSVNIRWGGIRCESPFNC